MGDKVIQGGSQATYERVLTNLRDKAAPATVYTRGSHGETTGIDASATAMARAHQDISLQRQAASHLKDMQPEAPKAEPPQAAAPQDSAARMQAEKAATFAPSAIKFGN